MSSVFSDGYIFLRGTFFLRSRVWVRSWFLDNAFLSKLTKSELTSTIFNYLPTYKDEIKKYSKNHMILMWVGKVTSTIKGYHVCNYEYKIAKNLTFGMEPTSKHIQNTIAVKNKNQEVIGNVSEAFSSTYVRYP